jgi:hypothetical protein
VHVADELASFCWKIDPDTGLITNILSDKKNHLIDALRYSNERHRRMAKTMQPIEIMDIPVENRWNSRAG